MLILISIRRQKNPIKTYRKQKLIIFFVCLIVLYYKYEILTYISGKNDVYYTVIKCANLHF